MVMTIFVVIYGVEFVLARHSVKYGLETMKYI